MIASLFVRGADVVVVVRRLMLRMSGGSRGMRMQMRAVVVRPHGRRLMHGRHRANVRIKRFYTRVHGQRPTINSMLSKNISLLPKIYCLRMMRTVHYARKSYFSRPTVVNSNPTT